MDFAIVESEPGLLEPMIVTGTREKTLLGRHLTGARVSVSVSDVVHVGVVGGDEPSVVRQYCPAWLNARMRAAGYSKVAANPSKVIEGATYQSNEQGSGLWTAGARKDRKKLEAHFRAAMVPGAHGWSALDEGWEFGHYEVAEFLKRHRAALRADTFLWCMVFSGLTANEDTAKAEQNLSGFSEYLRKMIEAGVEIRPGMVPTDIFHSSWKSGQAQKKYEQFNDILGSFPHVAAFIAANPGLEDKALRRAVARREPGVGEKYGGIPRGLGLTKFSFAMELWGMDAACLDRWMLRALGAWEKEGGTYLKYKSALTELAGVNRQIDDHAAFNHKRYKHVEPPPWLPFSEGAWVLSRYGGKRFSKREGKNKKYPDRPRGRTSRPVLDEYEWWEQKVTRTEYYKFAVRDRAPKPLARAQWTMWEDVMRHRPDKSLQYRAIHKEVFEAAHGKEEVESVRALSRAAWKGRDEERLKLLPKRENPANPYPVTEEKIYPNPTKTDPFGIPEGAHLVPLWKKGSRKPVGKPITGVKGVVEFVGGISQSPQERLLVILLDQQNRPLGVVMVHQGTLTESLVGPREVFAPAVEARAAAIIIVHNHPSGNPQPSQPDIDLTKRLVAVGKTMRIPVLDHVIVSHYDDGEPTGTSIREEGLVRFDDARGEDVIQGEPFTGFFSGSGGGDVERDENPSNIAKTFTIYRKTESGGLERYGSMTYPSRAEAMTAIRALPERVSGGRKSPYRYIALDMWAEDRAVDNYYKQNFSFSRFRPIAAGTEGPEHDKFLDSVSFSVAPFAGISPKTAQSVEVFISILWQFGYTESEAATAVKKAIEVGKKRFAGDYKSFLRRLNQRLEDAATNYERIGRERRASDAIAARAAAAQGVAFAEAQEKRKADAADRARIERAQKAPRLTAEDLAEGSPNRFDPLVSKLAGEAYGWKRFAFDRPNPKKPAFVRTRKLAGITRVEKFITEL